MIITHGTTAVDCDGDTWTYDAGTRRFKLLGRDLQAFTLEVLEVEYGPLEYTPSRGETTHEELRAAIQDLSTAVDGIADTIVRIQQALSLT